MNDFKIATLLTPYDGDNTFPADSINLYSKNLASLFAFKKLQSTTLNLLHHHPQKINCAIVKKEGKKI